MVDSMKGRKICVTLVVETSNMKCHCYGIRFKNFSMIASPMIELLKKNVKFEWTDEDVYNRTR